MTLLGAEGIQMLFIFTWKTRPIYTLLKIYPEAWIKGAFVEPCVVGKSVHVRHVQLQREKVWTAGAAAAGWLHRGLQWPSARWGQLTFAATQTRWPNLELTACCPPPRAVPSGLDGGRAFFNAVKEGDTVMFASDDEQDRILWVQAMYRATGQSHKPVPPTQVQKLNSKGGASAQMDAPISQFCK